MFRHTTRIAAAVIAITVSVFSINSIVTVPATASAPAAAPFTPLAFVTLEIA